MKSVKPKDLAKILEKQGFILRRTNGSHRLYKHPDGRTTTLPYHKKDLPPGTLRAILKQAGLNKEDL